MAVTTAQVAELYVATFNRAPLAEGLEYWTSSDFSIDLIASCFFESTEAQAIYTDDGEAVSTREFVLRIYDNLFNHLPDTAGLEYWMNALDSGAVSQDEMILSVMNGAPEGGTDAQTLANKTTVALYYAESGLEGIYPLDEITADEATATAAMAEIDAMDPNTGTTYTLTANQDVFEGTTDDDTFFADVVQVNGVQANSLATGDDLQGGAGEDTLEAQVTEGAYIGGGNMAIQPRTSSIETVELEALESNLDDNVADRDGINAEVYVNAKNMVDIESLWSLHSDANLTIQNLTTLDSSGNMRSLSEMTIGMGYTGNDDTNWDESDLHVYFDQDYLNPEISLSDQVVTYRIMNEDAYDIDPDAPLDGVYVARLQFRLNGVSYDLADYLSEVEDPYGDGSEITTYTELRDQLRLALESLIADNPDVAELATMEIELGGTFTSDNNRVGTELTFTIPGTNEDGEENVLEVSEFYAEIRPAEGDDAVANSNRYERASIEDVQETQELRINVALEKVGLASDGGDLVIGSMAKDGQNQWAVDTTEQGIEIFDVTVYGDDSKPSALDSLRSTNNTLKEINVVSEDNSYEDYADLTIGNGIEVGDDDLHDGLKDIQTFNAEEFKGNLNIIVNLTDEIMDKYLLLDDDDDDYTGDNVDFVYTGGVGDDTMNFAIDGEPVSHEDFTFTVDSGDGDDIITTQIDFFGDVDGDLDDTWEYGDHKALDNLSIDTGAGNDVVRTWGDGDFIISTGSGNDTVYTNNDGLLNGELLVQEVQVITFGEAGDRNDTTADEIVTVTLSNGTVFTVDTIDTDDTAEEVATEVAAAITAQDGGSSVVATASGDQVELVYTQAYMATQTDTNGDVAMAIVSGFVTDVAMNVAEPTPGGITTPAEDAAVEKVTITTTVGGAAGDTITFNDGSAPLTLKDTDANGDVSVFEITQQLAAYTYSTYTVTGFNPSIGEVYLEGNTAEDTDDLTVVDSGGSDATPVVTQQGNTEVAEVGTQEVQTLTFTNGADQDGTIRLSIDVDVDGIIQDDEIFTINVGAGNEADVAADVAAAIEAIDGLSAVQGAAAPNLNTVTVTFEENGNVGDITLEDGAVRTASVAEETKGRLASDVGANDAGAVWVLNADNSELNDLNGTDVSADAIIYNATVTITLSGATFGSSGDDVTNAAAEAYDNGFEVTATIPTEEYVGNEYDLNQAIKDAIQNDTVMSMLLTVEDGPEDTLIITSNVDGKVLATDLAIEVNGPTSLSTADLAALNLVYKDIINNSDAADLSEDDMLDYINANLAALEDGYTSPVLATDAAGDDIAGATSVTESDNIINLGSGDDLVVLGTDAESNDTIVFTGSDIGTNAIFNFVADGTSGATDYLDFSEYLTNVFSASGSTASETAIVGEYLFNATALNENDVVFINNFVADTVNGETWDNLTADKLLKAIVNSGNTDYGSIGSADLDVSNANADLVGNEIKNIILVQNDENHGEYKVFEVTSSASSDEFTSIDLLGEVDFGEIITTMSIDDGLDNDGGQDDDGANDGGVVVPANTTYANAGTGATMIGTSSSDTFVVVGRVTDGDYITGATNGTKAAYFANAVEAIEDGVGGGSLNSNDSYQGGNGTDTMEIWGNVDFLNATIDSIEVFDIHSTVNFSLDQLEGATVNTQDDSVVNIDTDGDGATDITFQNDGLNNDQQLDDLQDYIDNGGVVVQDPTYTLTANAQTVNEGATARFTLTTTNVDAGTEVAYTISGVDADDVTGGLTGTVAILANGNGIINVALAADETTEGLETLTVTIDADQTATADVVVNDTSVEPNATYALAANTATVDEGATASFTLTTTGVDTGTEVAYTISGVDADDVTGDLTGTAEVLADGTAVIEVVLAADETTEGPETLTVTIDADQTATADVAVNDTSVGALAVNDSDFVANAYDAQDVAEDITVDLDDWTANFIINGFNAAEDELIINSDGLYTSAEDFIAANVVGELGTWGWEDEEVNVHLYNPNFMEINLAGITGATGDESISDAEAAGWLTFV